MVVSLLHHCGWTYVKVLIMAGSAWWSKIAHLMVARKEREGEGNETEREEGKRRKEEKEVKGEGEREDTRPPISLSRACL